MDTKSFNSKIGFITNLASNFIAMREMYEQDTPEYKELKRRIDLLRFYQGTAIDSTKGDVFIPPPKFWSKRSKYITITDDMSEEEKANALEQNKVIAFNNKICGDKKPYFFGYIYPAILSDYKNHKKTYRNLAVQQFGKSLNDIIYSSSRTPEEQKFYYQYMHYNPLLETQCTMNTLAKYIDGIEFDNVWKKPVGDFDYTILMSGNYKIIKNNLYREIEKIIRMFNNSIRTHVIDSNYIDEYHINSLDEYMGNKILSISEYYETIILQLDKDIYKVADYFIYIYYNQFKTYSKSLLWDVFGSVIVNNVKEKSKQYSYPVLSDDGEEYLGKKYIIKQEDITCNMTI